MVVLRNNRRVDARALAVLWLGACAVFGPVGCGSTQPGTGVADGGESAAGVGNAGDAGAHASAGAAAAGGSAGEAGGGGAEQAGEASAAGTVNVPDPPWNEHSQRFELSDCFGFFEGTMAFSADRAQLNAEQLQALAGLERAPGKEYCLSDPMDCHVVITSDRGEVTEYLADKNEDAFCDRPEPKLAWRSVAPVLAALGCKFSKESAGPLAPSPGCFHGMSPNFPIHQQLSLPEANRKYHVEVDGCLSGTVTLELFGADASVPLAIGMPVGEPGSWGTCAALEIEVQAPIIADLVITREPGFEAVDFYVNFR